MTLSRFTCALLLGWSGFVFAKPSAEPDLRDFFKICREHRQPSATVAAPAVGVTKYFPTSVIEGTQSRFSFDRFLDTLRKAQKSTGLSYSDRDNAWFFTNNRGLSAYGLEKRLTGIFYRGRIYIVDGHHRALVTLYTGAQTVPVRILDDLSRLNRGQFFTYLREHRLSYFRNYRGLETDPIDICDMADDPNYQLARFLIRRVDVAYVNGHFEVSNDRGAKMPIAIKINQDIPYFENEIADALHRAGVIFDPIRDKKDLSYEELDEYLAILKRAARNESSSLNRILLLDRPTPVAEIKLKVSILEHFAKFGCEDLLTKKAN
jgi:hypothetical protein